MDHVAKDRFTHGWRLRALLAAAILMPALLLPAVLPPPADAFVYWTRQNMQEDCIGRANNNGSAVDPYFITGCSGASGVTVSGGWIYWTNMRSHSIGRARIDGTQVNQQFITGCRYPDHIAVGPSDIYWTNWDPHGNSTIARARVDGTEVNQNLISTHAVGLSYYNGHIYWTYSLPNVNTGAIWMARAAADGSQQEKLLQDYDLGPIQVMSDDYFYVGTGDAIGVGQLPSGPIYRTWIKNQPNLGSPFTVHDGHIFWITGYNGVPGEMNYIGVVRTDGFSANPTLLAAGVGVRGVDADGGSVAAATQDLALDVQEHVALPAGLKASLKAKLLAARAAYERGAYKTTLNVLHATANEIKAQSGKAIPTETAERWLLVLERLQKVVPEAGSPSA